MSRSGSGSHTAVLPPHKDSSSDSYYEFRTGHDPIHEVWAPDADVEPDLSVWPQDQNPLYDTAYTLTGVSLNLIWPLTYERTLQTPNTPEHLV